DSPWPLPFACIENRRSFVHVDDLVRLLIECASHPAAANGTFMAAHAEPVSTARLLAALREALSRSRRLFCVPAGVLDTAARIAGAGEKMARLTHSLEVDPSATRTTLGWSAAVGIEEAIREMAREHLEARA
ncbi:MAG TPA: NAD-dependent dehydratase, partial [Usitatibacter sp.]|nr:NAD-dependent dehydratase [Usitatibacter sp.]